MVEALARKPGALAYVELLHALRMKLMFGAVKNKAGKFILADLQGVTKAAENSLKNIPEDLRFSLTDADGDDSYPISGTTWAVDYVDQNPETGRLLFDFFTWATHEGQKYNEDMHYAKLPEPLVQRIDEKLKKIKK